MTRLRSAQHIIGRLFMEVSASDEAHAEALRLEMSALLTGAHFMDELNTLFDRIAAPGELIEIDRLELDIRMDTPEILVKNLIEALSNAIPAQVNKAAFEKQLDTSTLEPPRNSFEKSWFYFLEYGLLPWHCTDDHKSRIVNASTLGWTVSESAIAQLKRLFLRSPRALVRFLQWISTDSVPHWMGRLFQMEEDDRKFFEQWLFQTQSEQAFIKTTLLPHIFRQLADHHSIRVIIPELLEEDLKTVSTNIQSSGTTDFGNEQKPIETRPELQPTGSDLPAETGIYLQNAGIVLLANALPGLFEQLKWVQNRQFVHERARCKALYFLQYLASGQAEVPEFELPLNKILCGMRPEELPLFPGKLTKREINSADNLLKTLIKDWKVLKNTTPIGLRGLFLQREGSLTPTEPRAWKLTINRKTEDILLDRLPPSWGFSIIKLPWMTRLLFVNWR